MSSSQPTKATVVEASARNSSPKNGEKYRNGNTGHTEAGDETIELMEVKKRGDFRGAEGPGEGKQTERGLTLNCDCRSASSRVGHIVNLVLVISNMLNYMDRYTIAGLLDDVEKHYAVSKSQVGLLQSSFIICYMLMSPAFGYLGDRFNRKYIMVGSILVWSGVTLASSFIPSDYFFLFLVMRGLLGVGEAGYCTVAPTIIADLFSQSTRSKALAVFYFAIPVGSGLGYIVGSEMAKALGGWQWALRATPGLGLVCVVLIMLLVKEPPRGNSEGGTSLSVTSWRADLLYLVKHKSFMLSSAGFTCVSFVVGALAWWAPSFIAMSIDVQGHAEAANSGAVNFIFGVITCLAGFSGVALGSGLSLLLRRWTPRADPLICGAGLIAGAPFLYVVIVFSRYSTTLTWISIYIGETLVSLNWALVTDILLYVVIPTRRSTATSLQILMCHVFGDAGSPYLVGLIFDAVNTGSRSEYECMQFALYMTCFVGVIGGGFFLGAAIHVHHDRTKANQAIKDAQTSALDGVATQKSEHSVNGSLLKAENKTVQLVSFIPSSSDKVEVEARISTV